MAEPNELLRRDRTQHLSDLEQRSFQLQTQLRQEQLQGDQQLQQQEQAMARLVLGMETEAHIERAAPQSEQRLSHWEHKKQEERQRADEKAARQEAAVRQREAGLLAQRRLAAKDDAMTPAQIKAEKVLLTEKLRAISLREKAALAAPGLTEEEKRKLRWQAQQERAEAAGAYACTLPLGEQERAEAMAVKEKQELKANKLGRLYQVTQLPTLEERKREEATLARHAKYDALKACFRKENYLSHQDAVYEHPETGHSLVNVGRAHMGGTKPMYIFEDRDAPILQNGQVVGYKQYLFKEAVNCVGCYKPEGALVTEAAAKLQDILCGPYSIPAFAARDAKGRVLGSFQEKIELKQEQRVDLFAWQANPKDNLSEEMKGEILREHTLDWLLCNFDTKGENFLHRTDGHLSSFDKEASFSKLKDPGAAHMSTDYKPHANDTLYNTLFTEFAQGRIKLDLSANLKQIERMEEMSEKEYLALFSGMLEQKYGKEGPRNKARARAEAAISARKENLREEYRRFYTELLQRRRKALLERGERDDGAGLLNDVHQYRFQGET